MTMTSLGDLSTHFLLRRSNVALRTEATRLGQELSTGLTSAPLDHLRGDVSMLADIERRMSVAVAYRQATQEATVRAETMQTALGQVQELADDLLRPLLAASASGFAQAGNAASVQAMDTLDRMVAALNTQSAGRSLFAGNATDQPALTSASAIMGALQTVTAGLTDPADIVAAVDGWFDDPIGGFAATAYLGGADPLAPIRVAEGEAITLDIRANRQEIRDMLRPVALAALASDATLGLSPQGRSDLLTQAGQSMLAGQDGLSAIRGDLGLAQARLDQTTVRHASEQTGLQQARLSLLGVDPYETASRLEQVRFNLESLYTVTVRLSRLNLTEYM